MNPQIKDTFYKELAQEPTLEKFREFIHNNCGEFDNIDFKADWVSKGKLSKLLLAFANSGGGIIVFGIKEEDDKTLSSEGLAQLKDPADVNNDIAKYVPPEVDYEILDFVYNTSEYEKLQGKKFQMIVVNHTPDRLPFVSMNEAEDIDKDCIYVRRGTKCEKANAKEINEIIYAKIATIYSGNSDMSLSEHLVQLKTLYDELPQKIKVLVEKGEPSVLERVVYNLGKKTTELMGGTPDVYKEEDNPNYPKESYEAFILRMVNAKKLRIEKVLDVK